MCYLFLQVSCFGTRLHGKVDLLIFNPPYVVTTSDEVTWIKVYPYMMLCCSLFFIFEGTKLVIYLLACLPSN